MRFLLGWVINSFIFHKRMDFKKCYKSYLQNVKIHLSEFFDGRYIFIKKRSKLLLITLLLDTSYLFKKMWTNQHMNQPNIMIKYVS